MPDASPAQPGALSASDPPAHRAHDVFLPGRAPAAARPAPPSRPTPRAWSVRGRVGTLVLVTGGLMSLGAGALVGGAVSPVAVSVPGVHLFAVDVGHHAMGAGGAPGAPPTTRARHLGNSRPRPDGAVTHPTIRQGVQSSHVPGPLVVATDAPTSAVPSPSGVPGDTGRPPVPSASSLPAATGRQGTSSAGAPVAPAGGATSGVGSGTGTGAAAPATGETGSGQLATGGAGDASTSTASASGASASASGSPSGATGAPTTATGTVDSAGSSGSSGSSGSPTSSAGSPTGSGNTGGLGGLIVTILGGA